MWGNSYSRSKGVLMDSEYKVKVYHWASTIMSGWKICYVMFHWLCVYVKLGEWMSEWQTYWQFRQNMMSTSSITQKRQIKVVIGRQVNICYPKSYNWLLIIDYLHDWSSQHWWFALPMYSQSLSLLLGLLKALSIQGTGSILFSDPSKDTSKIN